MITLSNQYRSYKVFFLIIEAFCDTPPNSLMDSTANPKVKITEREGVATCSLARSTSGVEGRVGAPKWD
jgi:hypothetical protein